jgi:tetratricopeptide (TPR) repeat protein
MDNGPEFDRLLAAGLAASSENRSEEAVQLFARAAAVAPASGVPHFLIGSEHASRGNVDAAEFAFANAVLLAPEFTLARYQLGLLQFTSERAAVALLTWEPLLALPPEQALPHFVRGFAALAQDRYDAALAHYRRGLACANDSPPLFADVQHVVEAVQALVDTGDAADSGEPEASHVLLSGYARVLH